VTDRDPRDTLRRVRPLCLLLCIAGLAGCSSKPSGPRVRVAAASDLAKAFEEIAKEFKTRTGITPEITYSSSGLLSKQIEQGAPFFLFASASQEFVANVVKAGVCDGTSARMYGRGRIVVWTRSEVPAPARLEDLADAKRFPRIGIANPKHAPYGRAAQQALEKSGLWDQVAPRIAEGDSIQAAMLYARNKQVDVAIVALSLAVVADGGAYLPIDQSLHDPLDQQLVVCGNGPEADAARQLAAFIGSREGREIMARYGFSTEQTQRPRE
jgi:molybdate transport system substrate-binding protein